MRRIKYAITLIMIGAICLCAESEGYKEWLKRRDALRQDKSVERYYTFEDVADSKSVVKDLGRDGADLKFVPFKDANTGEVFDDLQVIEGRWPEKKAVRLDRGWYQGPPSNIKDKEFTVEIWFRKNGPGSIFPRAGKGAYLISAPAGWGAGWRLITEYSPAYLSFDIGIERNNVRARSDKMYSDNVWHHAAATWDGREMRLYVDGVLAASSLHSGEYVPSNAPFRIGFRSGGSVILDVDEAVIYNRVLSAKDIEKLGRGLLGVSEKEVFSKADAFIKTGDYKSARAEYEKLKGLPSYGMELALFNMAESYRMEKDYAGAHKTYNEIMKLNKLTDYYRIYCMFRQAEVYLEQKDYSNGRRLYEAVTKMSGALEEHLFKARLKTADMYRMERNHSRARNIYERLLKEEESSAYPHEGHRLELRDRLEGIEGLADGSEEKSCRQKRHELLNSSEQSLYVSPEGNDNNPGTKEKPFATMKRAREEAGRLKTKGGVSVFLRGGKYFISESLSFGIEDSGKDDNSPVVYRSYPGEEVRIIGGRQITNFKPLSDTGILSRLPDESRGKIWVSDLKEAGITEYGNLAANKGTGESMPHGMELFFDGKPMRLARWPNEGHARVAGITKKDGEMCGRGPYQLGSFVYSDNRPERWLEEKDVWLHGFWYMVFSKDHVKLESIDTQKKTISLLPGARGEKTAVGVNMPYYAYNLLSELDSPGEWYLDRDTGRLYFYPPDNPETGEIIVSTLDAPLLVMDGVSNVVFSGMTFECTQRNGIEIKNGRNNLIAGSVIKNTGQWGVIVNGGWEHAIAGCDIHDVGAGGISLDGGDRVKLIPSRHLAENNHIYSFNRFDQGYRQGISIDGCGQRVSHNVIHDSPMQGLYFNAMDHVIEFNELHDVVHEGRELGAMYVYGAHNGWRWMNRGTVIRNNFIHHISYHFSPNLSAGLNCIHVDGRNGGMVIENNIFYRFPNGISCSHPDMHLVNNIFVDAERWGISLGERGMDFFISSEGEPLMGNISEWVAKLKSINYKQPPWNYRFPQLAVALMDKTPMRTKDTVVERNINTGGPFIAMGGIVKEDNPVRNNWDGENLLFLDRDNMNFDIRPGSPVYGLTGCEPLSMNNIGVYEDRLRASWPIKRTRNDIGRYYKPGWTPLAELSQTQMAPLGRVSKALEYDIMRRKSAIVIDGRLEKEEWAGLDRSKSMVIEQYYTGEKQKGPRSYAWLQYDEKYLYVGVYHEPDPFTEAMTPLKKDFKNPFLEVDMESQMGTHSRGWWSDDMSTGPIYIISGNSEGKITVINKFGMPYRQVKKLEEMIEYRATVLNSENVEWSCEMKIPLSEMGINPADADRLAFNIGTNKRSGLFAWVATGSSFWRLENAGFIRFAK
ncbi:MAG TPA: right-handed parallel beta-helix repeat-containing protein [bacterium]|nr:right-handed parallel beta-helix repeat-containing protein [bacterium]